MWLGDYTSFPNHSRKRLELKNKFQTFAIILQKFVRKKNKEFAVVLKDAPPRFNYMVVREILPCFFKGLVVNSSCILVRCYKYNLCWRRHIKSALTPTAGTVALAIVLWFSNIHHISQSWLP
jgi:hypothetical protein